MDTLVLLRKSGMSLIPGTKPREGIAQEERKQDRIEAVATRFPFISIPPRCQYLARIGGFFKPFPGIVPKFWKKRERLAMKKAEEGGALLRHEDYLE